MDCTPHQVYSPPLYNWLVSLQSCFTWFSLPSISVVYLNPCVSVTIISCTNISLNITSDLNIFGVISAPVYDLSQWRALFNDG